jgi:hypothetical protein
LKKIFKNILFIVILAGLLYIPGIILSKNAGIGDVTTKSMQGVHTKLAEEEKETIDTIVVGDSESYTSISPMQLWNEHGFTAYAAGEPGARLSEVKAVLDTAFSTQKPKLVMLETNVLFRPDKEDAGTQGKIAERMCAFFPLFKEHNAWKRAFVTRKDELYKGFAISSKVKPYAGSYDYMSKGSLPSNIEEDNLKIFREIKRMCEENGSTLVLYSSPSPVNYNTQRHNVLKDLADAEGLDYIDLNTKLDELDIDWETDTRDRGDHLNVKGARKTTAFLGKYLEEKYGLPDRRSESCAKEWDDLCHKYMEKLSK